jgi:hypothetical protein
VNIYELEIPRGATAIERRYLRWELLACEEVLGVFRTPREDLLAVLFDGEPRAFHDWAGTLAPQAAG